MVHRLALGELAVHWGFYFIINNLVKLAVSRCSSCLLQNNTVSAGRGRASPLLVDPLFELAVLSYWSGAHHRKIVEKIHETRSFSKALSVVLLPTCHFLCFSLVMKPLSVEKISQDHVNLCKEDHICHVITLILVEGVDVCSI